MKLVRVLVLLFLGAALASCGPVPVDGLFFSLQDGGGSAGAGPQSGGR
jgi:hypothetical protein